MTNARHVQRIAEALRPRRPFAFAVIAATVLAVLPAQAIATPQGATSSGTTAWRNGALQVDTKGVVSRSDLVLDEPAWREEQSMPLGNGRLGAAVWARDGLTAQFNRNDTFPDLKSAGRLVVPGLEKLTSAAKYEGRLSLYDAQLVQHGNGMTARAYTRAGADQFVLDVDGADPTKAQTADLKLWSGRTPTTYAGGGVAALAETFADEKSRTTHGAIAAATADGRNVHASVTDDLTVHLRFRPHRDGSFRVVVGVPAYTGGDVPAAARDALRGAFDPRRDAEHLRWWHRFWTRQADPMRITSPDGTGEYMEALRAQQLYTTAATQRNDLPTGQAGAANMLYPWRDSAVSAPTWFHFNLRQQVFANYGAGTATFNAPYLRLYTEHLEQMKAWTKAHWPGAEGVCVPELIRFDGTPDGCDSSAAPTWTNRILSGGLEVAHDIWQTYRFTGDASFLAQGYPLMREVARFYLSILKPGADGRLHLEHVNSLETQWDTTDPMPDVAGMRVMFPIIARLAGERGNGELAARLRTASAKLPALPTTTRAGKKVLAWSATDEPAKNTQNTDLEALLPWGQVDAKSELAQATFRERVFPLTREWDEDAIWAARLHRPDAMKRLLVQGTKDLQKYPNGFTVHGKNDDPSASHNMYSSWNAVVAGALQDGLVQSYDGTVRVAAGWPANWDVDGSVQIAGGHRVSTQVRHGSPNIVGIQAGSNDSLRIANPWPGQAVQVVDGRCHCGSPSVGPTRAGTLTLHVLRGRSYVLERVRRPVDSLHFRPVTGAPATAVKHLGGQTLGVTGGTPQIDSDVVTDVTPEKLHALVRAQPGAPLYVDRSDTIADLPPALDGAVQIQGAQSDAKATTPPDYLSFHLTHPAPVYVAFDARGEGKWWPAWLQQQGFEPTGKTIGTHEYLRRFQIVNGRLRASGGGVTLSRAGADWGDQTIDVTVQQIQVGASIMFRAPDSRNGYVWNIGGPLGSPGGLGQLRMSRMVNGSSTLIGSVVPITPAPGNKYHLHIETTGDHIRTFIDGHLVDDRHDATFPRGHVGVYLGGSDVGEYDNVKVSAPDGSVLFHDSFSGDLSAWDVPPGRQDVPLAVFKKHMPAGRVTLGPNSGIAGQGDASYVTFVGGGT